MSLHCLVIHVKELESTPIGLQMTPKPGQGSTVLWIRLHYFPCFFLLLLNNTAVFSVVFFLELRHRNVMPKTPSVAVNPASVAVAAARPPLASGPTYPGRSSHSAPGGPPERNLSAIAAQQSLMRKPVTPGTPVPGIGELPAHRGTTS